MRSAKKFAALLAVTALLCLSFSAESAAPNPASKVTGVALSAGTPVNLGNDELRYNFTGAITVNGPTVVEYIWLRNDDVRVHTVYKLVFGAAGTQTVQSHWDVTKTDQVQHLWVEIKTLSPNQFVSKQLAITVPAKKKP